MKKYEIANELFFMFSKMMTKLEIKNKTLSTFLVGTGIKEMDFIMDIINSIIENFVGEYHIVIDYKLLILEVYDKAENRLLKKDLEDEEKSLRKIGSYIFEVIGEVIKD